MDERAKRVERRLEVPLLIAALLTIPAIVIEQSSMGEPWRTCGQVLNWTIWIVFVGQVVVMLALVPNRWRWIRDHPLDIAIVILTPPFLPPSLQAARVFRLLRILRLVRGATLARRLLSTEGVRDASVLALLTILGGGAAFAAVERPEQNLSAWDGVWWATTTVSTVGYGDIQARTDAGRLIGIGVMLIGVGFVAILTAAAADRFIENRARASATEAEVLARLADIAARLDAIEMRDR